MVERWDLARADRAHLIPPMTFGINCCLETFLDDRNRQWSVGDAGLEDAIYVRSGGGAISEQEDSSIRVFFNYIIVILIIVQTFLDSLPIALDAIVPQHYQKCRGRMLVGV
jgi:hypothetical protein